MVLPCRRPASYPGAPRVKHVEHAAAREGHRVHERQAAKLNVADPLRQQTPADEEGGQKGVDKDCQQVSTGGGIKWDWVSPCETDTAHDRRAREAAALPSETSAMPSFGWLPGMTKQASPASLNGRKGKCVNMIHPTTAWAPVQPTSVPTRVEMYFRRRHTRENTSPGSTSSGGDMGLLIDVPMLQARSIIRTTGVNSVWFFFDATSSPGRLLLGVGRWVGAPGPDSGRGVGR